MNIEDSLTILNRRWTFKIFAFIVLSFPTFQNYGQLQNILLALVLPKFKCVSKFVNDSAVKSISTDQCFVTLDKYNSVVACDKFLFSPKPVGKTLASEFNLVCKNSHFIDLILIAWYSTAFTAVLSGSLADKYGRKKLAVINLSLETIASIGLALSPNLGLNFFFRILLGISGSGVYITYVWLLEIVDTNFRSFVGSFYWLFGCVAYMIFPFIVYGTRDWRTTQLYSMFPSIIYLFILFLPESPRWLYVVGKRETAKRSLENIAKINGIYDTVYIKKLKLVDEDIKEEERSILQALKSGYFIKRVVVSFLLMFATFIFYSAVTVNLNILSNNIFISMFFVGFMESPSLVLSFFILKYMKRKKSTILLGGTGSCLFLLSVFFSKDIYWQSIVRIFIGCIAKVAIASVNQTTMVYIAELFPTCFRSMSMYILQVANFLSFAGAIYINKLENYAFFLPMLLYFVLIWTISIMVMFTLPETKDLPFPETVTDIKHYKVGHESEYLEYMLAKSKEIDEFQEQDFLQVPTDKTSGYRSSKIFTSDEDYSDLTIDNKEESQRLLINKYH